MINFIPIFPLHIVVFPGESLNLHIFESRYKQLVNECYAQKKPFGIPSVINSEVQDHGALVYINEITNRYDNGEMDIKTKGDKVFRILEVIQTIPGKLFAGAIVNYPENSYSGSKSVMKQLVAKMRQLHAHLQVVKDFHKAETELNSYDIAHHSGLTILQEYELLQLTNERQRQEFLKRHFDKALPAVEDLKLLKEKIQMNGHFKNIDGFEVK